MKGCAEHGVPMTVPSSARVFHFLSLSEPCHSGGWVASFSPVLISLSGSLPAVCATKPLDSLLVDSAVKCINFPSLFSLGILSDKNKKNCSLAS